MKFWTSLRAFSLITPLTRVLFKRTFLNQIKTTSSKSLLSLILNLWRPEFIWPDSNASMVFVLFVMHVEIVFFLPHSFAIHFSGLWISSIFFNTFYFSVIEKFILFTLTQNFLENSHCLFVISRILLYSN